jgi:general secretion pathway protein D
MKKILLLLMWISCLQANSNIDIQLVNFVEKVSQQNNIIIYIDEDIKDKKVSVLIPDKVTNSDLFSLLKITISKMNFILSKRGKVYYLTKKKPIQDKSYLYKLKYNSSVDCTSVLNILKAKYIYLADSNTFVITASSNKYKEVKSFLKSVDTKQKQVILKIMIFEFDEDDVQERGFQYSSIYKTAAGAVEVAVNSIIAPIATTNNFLSNINFYSALKLLNETNVIKVKQYPYILAKNNKKFVFEAVENIPYLIKSTTTEATNTSEENSIEYKDVGLKIYGTSLIYDEYVTLDLDLYMEDLLNDNTSTPKTNKRHLNSNTDVYFNKVLLLGGIKRTKYTKTNVAIPFISNIPYLGEIFKYSYDSNSKLNVTIAIEVLDPDNLPPVISPTFKNIQYLDDVEPHNINNILFSDEVEDDY